MYIAVSAIQINYNPGSFYIQAQVVSSGGTNIGIEVFADDDSTAEVLHSAIAEEAREACRANSESIAVDAPVMIFGSVARVT